MIRKYGCLIFLILLSSSLLANFYQIDFYLVDYIPLLQNKPSYFNDKPGVSLSIANKYNLGAYNQTISYVIDHKNKYVVMEVKSGKLLLAGPFYISFDDYLNNSFEAAFANGLVKAKKELFDPQNKGKTQGLIPEIVIKLPPMAMPKTIRKIMGNKAGRLNLSGTQKLTISGSQTKRNTKAVIEGGSNQSFNLSMQQDLNLTMNGSIGEKIKVDIKYNSNQETGILDPNNIKIAYEGEEDEIVQRIDAGNTSLSLSGSRYISLSASSQGLFGVKSLLKIGSLDITAVASKEESQKNSKSFEGTSQSDSTIINIKNYVPRTHYYISDPQLLYSIYSEGDNCPPTWVNNAIKTNNGAWYIAMPNIFPKEGTLKVFLDDDNASNNENIAVEGQVVDEQGTLLSGTYFFEQLLEGTDYTFDYDTGILVMHRTIDKRYTIGVSYTRKDNIEVGNTSDDNIQLKALKLKNQDINDFTWKYQCRNIYSLNMNNIKSDGFLLEVFTESATMERILTVPDSIPHTGYSTFNDFLRLDSDGNGVVNGEDTTVNLSAGYITFPFIEPFRSLHDSYIYEQDPEQIYSDEYYKHSIFVRGKVGRESINLGMMIFPGSVKVKVNGKEMKENVDYLVDYDFGMVTFLSQEAKNPDAKISIDYENKPLFAIESKTLLGLRADWKFSENAKLGGTFIYHSEKVSDKKPKIGNESRSLILADIDGEVKFQPEFMTQAVDLLPLIKTNTPSNISLSGEIAMNVPRIYNSSSSHHKHEAWLDDMESVLETYPLGTGRITWSPASAPYMSNMQKGKTNWFNPNNIYAREVYHPSTLSTKEGNEKVSVLSLKALPPKIASPGISNPYWGGLMKFVGNQVDFSEKEYIEILVRVDSLGAYQTLPKLHFDLGDTSEDFYTDFGGKNVLNTEDGKNGGDANGQLEYMEDIGLDGIPRKNNSGMINPGSDPEDQFSAIEINGEFPFINGTEGNGRLDTEDLNGNGSLDTLERFYRYSVTLKDTTSTFFQNQYNGWYLYRIPLKNNPYMQKFSNATSEADLKKISYVRMWVETENMVKLNFVNLDIVGNKWIKYTIRERDEQDLIEQIVPVSEITQNSEYFAIETADNQKSNHYIAPPHTTERGNDGEISFEQALKLNYYNVQPGHLILARQRFREQFNLLNYNRIKYWVYPEKDLEHAFNTDSLTVVFRLGADSLTYYEISKKIKVNPWQTKMTESQWTDIDFSFKDLTYLKSLNELTDTLYVHNGITYRKVRQATLSNIREIALGIYVPKNENGFNGTVFFNEIRVVDPNQNVGFAARATFDSKFADFVNFKIDYEWKTSDFYTTTSRSAGANTALEDKTSINISNRYALDKFFPVTWGVNLPLSFIKSNSIGIPRYKANSDMLRSNLSEDDKEREKNISETESVDVTFNLSKTPTNKILAYTIKNINLAANLKQTSTLTSTRADTVVTWRGSANYKLDLPKEKVKINLLKNYQLYYFPKYFNNDFVIRGEQPERWDYYKAADSSGWSVRPQTIDIKQIETTNEIKYDILSDLNLDWKLMTKRDLMQRYVLYNYNIGEETERTQNLQSTYNPTFTQVLFDLTLNGQVQYKENRRAFKQNNETNDDQFEYKYDGNVNRAFKAQTTIKNSSWLSALANLISVDPSKHYEANIRESGKDFSDSDYDFEGKDDTAFMDKEKGFEEKKPEEKMDIKKEEELKKREEEKMKMSEKERAKIEEKEKMKADGKDIDEKMKEKLKEKEKEAIQKDPISIRNIAAEFIGIMARLQNFNVTFENTYGTLYEQLEKRPGLAYQIGIPTMANEDLKQRNVDNSFDISSGFPLFRNLVSDFRYSTIINKRYASASNQMITTTWPDIRLTLSNFESLIGAENYLASSRLNTGFIVQEKLSGDINWEKPNTEIVTTAFQPLLGFTGNWTNSISSSISYSVNTTKNVSNQSTYNIVKNSRKDAIAGSVSYSFTAENGFKIPFIGSKLILRNQMESELGIKYETEFATTEGRDSKQTDKDTSKISVIPRASYNFHQNVKGGMTGTYDISYDNRRKESLSIFRLDIWVEIQF